MLWSFTVILPHGFMHRLMCFMLSYISHLLLATFSLFSLSAMYRLKEWRPSEWSETSIRCNMKARMSRGPPVYPVHPDSDSSPLGFFSHLASLALWLSEWISLEMMWNSLGDLVAEGKKEAFSMSLLWSRKCTSFWFCGDQLITELCGHVHRSGQVAFGCLQTQTCTPSWSHYFPLCCFKYKHFMTCLKSCRSRRTRFHFVYPAIRGAVWFHRLFCFASVPYSISW